MAYPIDRLAIGHRELVDRVGHTATESTSLWVGAGPDPGCRHGEVVVRSAGGKVFRRRMGGVTGGLLSSMTTNALPPVPVASATVRAAAARLGSAPAEPSDRLSELAAQLGGPEAALAPTTPVEGDGSEFAPAPAVVSDTPHSRSEPDSRSRIQIFDASTRDAGNAPQLLGSAADVLPEAAPHAARLAQQTVGRAMDYLLSHGRDGVGDDGGVLVVRVDDTTLDDQGNMRHEGGAGYYTDSATAVMGTDESLRFGRGLVLDRRDGQRWSSASFAGALDVTLHELTHGIIKHETGDLGGSADQAGASHEALGDMLAAAATRDWVIGESAFQPDSDIRALRDIARPDRADVSGRLYESVSEYYADQADGHVEEHMASGIISRSGYRIQQQIGWEPFERLIWTTLEGGNLGSLSFADTAYAMRSAAHHIWGPDDARTAVVDAELRRAGL